MANFLRAPQLSRILLSSTIIAFSISTLPQPAHAYIETAINLNDVAFAVRIEKIIKKINTYKKNNNKKIIESMFNLKLEIEGYTGQKIDLNKQLDLVEKEIKRNGGQLKKGGVALAVEGTINRVEEDEDKKTKSISLNFIISKKPKQLCHQLST